MSHSSTDIPLATKPERIQIVDALRGFALLGLFLVHCVERFELYWINPQPDAVVNSIFFLFGGKAYAIFAMLFGLSFFIIMERQARKGINFSGRFVWRLLVLLAIGYLHTLIYLGDILEVLAVIGLCLVVAQYWSNRTLLLIAAACILQLPGLYHICAALAQWPGGNDQPVHWGLYNIAYGNIVNADFPALLASNAWHGNSAKIMYFVESGRGIQLAGLFMVGLVLGRIGFFTQLQKFTRARQISFWLALIAAALLLSIKHYVGNLPDTVFQPQGMAKYYVDQVLESYAATALMALWVLIFIQLYHWRIGGRLLNLLAPCGRMSLSIYLSQALICVPLFYPAGLSWYNSISSTQALCFGFVMFALLMAWAHWWMKYFYYGPVEWLWRAATYTSLQVPFKRS